MLQADYNTFTKRCAQLLLLLCGDKTIAKAHAAHCLSSLKGELLPSTAAAVTVLRLTAFPSTAQGGSRAVDDAAWACVLADVEAAVDAS